MQSAKNICFRCECDAFFIQFILFLLNSILPLVAFVLVELKQLNFNSFPRHTCGSMRYYWCYSSISCLHTSNERSHTAIITWKQNETTNNDDDVVLLLFDCTRVQIVSGFDMKNKSVQIWWRRQQHCCRSTLSFKVTWWISFLVQFHFQFSKFYFYFFFSICRRLFWLSRSHCTHIAHIE